MICDKFTKSTNSSSSGFCLLQSSDWLMFRIDIYLHINVFSNPFQFEFSLFSSENVLGELIFGTFFFPRLRLTPFGMAILINYWYSFATKSIFERLLDCDFLFLFYFPFFRSNLQLSKLPIQIFIVDAINFTKKKALYPLKAVFPIFFSLFALGRP